MAQQGQGAFELDFEVSNEYIDETKQLYKDQLTNLVVPDKQKCLWHSLALGRKNNMPLLQLIFDSYSRGRTDHYLKTKKNLELHEWMKNTLGNLFAEKQLQILKAGTRTFSARYASAICLPTMEKICDRIEDFAACISGASSFIKTLISKELISPPFQMELVIIPHKVISVFELEEDEEEDPDDDDNEDDYDSYSEEEKGDEYDKYEEIKNIKKQLDAMNVMYEQKSLNRGCRGRDFYELYKAFKNKMGQKTNDILHNQRLCIIFDRREGLKQSELLLFKPPEHGDMPNNKVAEWGLQASFECLIPSIHQKEIITAQTPAKGYVFTLSFKVEEKDHIECHLHHRGGILRFLPSDIINVFPELFVMSQYGNDKFIKNEEEMNKNYLDQIELCDSQFDKFRSHINVNQ